MDEMLALTGQSRCVQVAVVMPTPEERAELDRIDRQLDEITKRLSWPRPDTPSPRENAR